MTFLTLTFIPVLYKFRVKIQIHTIRILDTN